MSSRATLNQNFAFYEDKRIRIPYSGGKYTFGVISDTHLCSRHQQITFLRWFYQYIKRRGAEFVLHAGDILNGDTVYRGQKFENFRHGFDDQVGYVVDRYPKNLPTYFITGNHDLDSFIHGGSDVGCAIASKRPDMHYLGQMGAYVYVGRIKIYIVHGMGAPAYALSYKLQKMVEAFSTENKPHMLIAGHWHSASQFFIRNIHAMTPGSFQGQTPMLKRLAIFPVIGGYLVEINTDKKGVASYKFEFIPLYKPKANDLDGYR